MVGPVIRRWEVCLPTPMQARRWFVRARQARARQVRERRAELRPAPWRSARRPSRAPPGTRGEGRPFEAGDPTSGRARPRVRSAPWRRITGRAALVPGGTSSAARAAQRSTGLATSALRGVVALGLAAGPLAVVRPAPERSARRPSRAPPGTRGEGRPFQAGDPTSGRARPRVRCAPWRRITGRAALVPGGTSSAARAAQRSTGLATSALRGVVALGLAVRRLAVVRSRPDGALPSEPRSPVLAAWLDRAPQRRSAGRAGASWGVRVSGRASPDREATFQTVLRAYAESRCSPLRMESFESARTSIWRMRSRVTPSLRPTCSSVSGSSPPKP